MFCTFARAASSIPCGNRQVREENSNSADFAGDFKVDFQSVLRTLESLFWFLVLLHVKYHKM